MTLFCLQFGSNYEINGTFKNVRLEWNKTNVARQQSFNVVESMSVFETTTRFKLLEASGEWNISTVLNTLEICHNAKFTTVHHENILLLLQREIIYFN